MVRRISKIKENGREKKNGRWINILIRVKSERKEQRAIDGYLFF